MFKIIFFITFCALNTALYLILDVLVHFLFHV